MPTILLAIVIYGGWAAATWWHASLPLWLLAAIGGWLIAWHGSLQHETIHGHPTGHRRIDDAIGSVPLSLWLPYAHYRRTHLAHHAAETVTDPLDDPESRYLAPGRGWTGRLNEMLERAQATLAGRLLLGPAIAIGRFLAAEAVRLRHDPRAMLREWTPHIIGVAFVAGWLALCRLPLHIYLMAFVYPGMSLTLLRSFAEHRASPVAGERVAVVESRGPLALLFLNNNLHAAHHRAAHVAWYRLPDWYRARRDALLRANGQLLYRGYGEVARLYLLRAHDRIIHPDHRRAAEV